MNDKYIVEKPMPHSVYQRLSTLSDPTRFRILRLVEQEELGVGELSRILKTPQSTVSRHLKVLQTGDWVQRRSVGTANLFSLDHESLRGDGLGIWTAAVAQIDPEDEPFASDQRRLKSVLALRGVNSREFFERHASRWDALRRDLFGERFMVPTLAAVLDEGAVVADLGCGTGEMLIQLAPVVHRIIGVDREQAMLAMARQRSAGMSNVDIREGSLEQLPIEDASIDLALCMLVLHHVDSPAAVFQEVKRVLRPTGLLLVLDMMAHEREELRMNMGHRHLGFSREHFSRDAAMGLVLERYQPLPDSPETLGPPLFIARFSRT
jgi:SAM-dependent methyltransferase